MNKVVIKKILSGAYFNGFISFYIAISSIIWIPQAINLIGLDGYSNFLKISLFFSTGIPGIFLLGYQSSALKFSADYWNKSPNKILPLYKYILKKVFLITVLLSITMIFSIRICHQYYKSSQMIKIFLLLLY